MLDASSGDLEQSQEFLVHTQQQECTCHANFQPAIGCCEEKGGNVVGICVLKEFLSEFGFVPKKSKKKKKRRKQESKRKKKESGLGDLEKCKVKFNFWGMCLWTAWQGVNQPTTAQSGIICSLALDTGKVYLCSILGGNLQILLN